MALFEVAPVSREVLTGAMERGFDDHEDAVPHEAALLSGAVAIVTRNGKDVAKATLRSEEHTSELQSLMRISYAVFCLKKKKSKIQQPTQISQQHTTLSTDKNHT